jgi:hypothetical protein
MGALVPAAEHDSGVALCQKEVFLVGGAETIAGVGLDSAPPRRDGSCRLRDGPRNHERSGRGASDRSLTSTRASGPGVKIKEMRRAARPPSGAVGGAS